MTTPLVVLKDRQTLQEACEPMMTPLMDTVAHG